MFYSSFVCISAYANVYFKPTIIKQNIKITQIVGMSSSQALPGFLITAPPSVCVSAVLGALAVWIQNQKKKKSEVLKKCTDLDLSELFNGAIRKLILQLSGCISVLMSTFPVIGPSLTGALNP